MALDWRQIQLPWVTLNAVIGGFMDFLAISGCDTSISFTRWRHPRNYRYAIQIENFLFV